MNCPRCNFELRPGARYCSNCGYVMTPASAAPPAAGPAPAGPPGQMTPPPAGPYGPPQQPAGGQPYSAPPQAGRAAPYGQPAPGAGAPAYPPQAPAGAPGYPPQAPAAAPGYPPQAPAGAPGYPPQAPAAAAGYPQQAGSTAPYPQPQGGGAPYSPPRPAQGAAPSPPVQQAAGGGAYPQAQAAFPRAAAASAAPAAARRGTTFTIMPVIAMVLAALLLGLVLGFFGRGWIAPGAAATATPVSSATPDAAGTPTAVVMVVTSTPEVPTAVPVNTEPPPAAGAIGSLAPSFVLTDVNDSGVALGDHNGKVVVVAFWKDTYAPASQDILNILQELQTDYDGDSQVAILSINSGDNKEVVRDFAARPERGYSFWLLLDSADGKTTADYGIGAWPTTLIIGPQGRIRERWEGTIPTKAELQAKIDELLSH